MSHDRTQFCHIDTVERDAPPSIREIMLREEPADQPDVDYLVTEYDEAAQHITKSDRYGDDDVKTYGWAKVKQWIDEDHARYESYGTKWWEMFIWADATIFVDGVAQRIQSGGLGGLESDDHSGYREQEMRGQVSELTSILKTLGFSDQTINDARVNEPEHEGHYLDVFHTQPTVEEYMTKETT